MNKVELLAPGGSMTGIRAAVAAGADAIYAGGSLFGARAYADNPDGDDILRAIDFCHLHGVRLYLTVNTLLKEEEMTGKLYDYILPVYERGVDAILVQDLGVFHFLKKNFPDLPLHASTQMTITGAPGARLLQQMGASRVVLSRELSLEDIAQIRRKTDVELETFIHGALCYCYSGQCLMSSLIGGRSGNRGRCAQPCRLPYELYEGFDPDLTSQKYGKVRMSSADNGRYLLSLKDICSLRSLPDLIDAGISSLKIEGRMKRPEYAAGVTAVYRKYIDLYRSEGRKGYQVDPEDFRTLSDLFSRGGFSEGYYKQKNGPSMMAMERPDHSGTPAARVAQVLAGAKGNRSTAQVRLTALEDLFQGDSLQIGGREYLMKEDIPAGKAFTAQGTGMVRKGEMVMRVRAQHLLDQLSERYVKGEPAQIPAEGFVKIAAGQPLTMTVRAEGTSACACGEKVQKADRRPLTEEAVRKQMSRTGDTAYSFSRLDLELDGDCFVPVSEMNRVRREALEKLEGEILRTFRRKAAPAERPEDPAVPKPGVIEHPPVTASVMTEDQLSAVLQCGKAGGVYIDASMFVYPTSEKPGSVIKRVHEAGKKAYLALPFIWRREVEQVFDRFLPAEEVRLFDGVLLRSIDQFGRLKDWLPLMEVIADAGVYTWNREAQKEVRQLGATWDTCPYECTAREMSQRESHASELVVYGRQPLMVTAQCLRKNTAGCSRKPSLMTLTDRRKIRFPVKSECAFCMNMIYNSVPLDLLTADDGRKIVRPGSVRYSFTTESGQETGRILRGELPGSITRGHIRKGVE